VYQKVESLSGGRRQLVVIVGATSFDPNVLILDEPTKWVLEPDRAEVPRRSSNRHLSPTSDIFEVRDRIMVPKRGVKVGKRQISETSQQEVLELVVQGTREAA
jgi:simple sugar transport system ATP-binding protein